MPVNNSLNIMFCQILITTSRTPTLLVTLYHAFFNPHVFLHQVSRKKCFWVIVKNMPEQHWTYPSADLAPPTNTTIASPFSDLTCSSKAWSLPTPVHPRELTFHTCPWTPKCWLCPMLSSWLQLEVQACFARRPRMRARSTQPTREPISHLLHFVSVWRPWWHRKLVVRSRLGARMLNFSTISVDRTASKCQRSSNGRKVCDNVLLLQFRKHWFQGRQCWIPPRVQDYPRIYPFDQNRRSSNHADSWRRTVPTRRFDVLSSHTLCCTQFSWQNPLDRTFCQ